MLRSMEYKEKAVKTALRIAKIVWRRTPPLRSVIEKDDFLQEAAVSVLSASSSRTDAILALLRALAMRIIRRAENALPTITLANDALDRFPAPARVDFVPDARRLRALPKFRVHKTARFRKSRMRFSLNSLATLLAKGYSVKEIADAFGLSPQQMAYWRRKGRVLCRKSQNFSSPCDTTT
ncbi:MAG TPA: hypothetical protein ENN09_02305 [Planctomycetes bacterium]|nr:hypothetical protein [Planctomycetota bacterium]